MKDITRRGFGIGAAGVLGAGVLGGNARAAVPMADVPPLNLPIERGASLRVLRPAKFVDPDEVVFRANSAKFTQATGVQVRIDFAGWEDIRPQTAVTANTGAGPDIVLGFTDDPHVYASKVVDLTDVATYLGKKYGGWYPLAERYGKQFGTEKWIAIPMGASGGLAVYRISWLKEAGFDAFPTTMDGMLDMCRKLKANGHPAGFSVGKAVGDANAFAHWLVFGFGGSMVDENSKVTINSKETIEALKFGKELYSNFIPGTASWLDTANNRALMGGEIGATQNGVSLYYSIKKSSDPKIAAMAADLNNASMPIGPVGHSSETATTINAMVFSHTKAPNAAKAYLAYMMEAPQYDPWLTQSFGYWSQPLKAYSESDVWKSDPKIAPYRDVMQNSLWLGYKGPITEQSGAVVADYVMVDMVSAAATGTLSPEDAAKEAERRAQRYYRS